MFNVLPSKPSNLYFHPLMLNNNLYGLYWFFIALNFNHIPIHRVLSDTLDFSFKIIYAYAIHYKFCNIIFCLKLNRAKYHELYAIQNIDCKSLRLLVFSRDNRPNNSPFIIYASIISILLLQFEHIIEPV